MDVVILVPARFASTRYPGKPLVPLRGATGVAKPLIERSFEAACRVTGASDVFVTTDDERVAEACRSFEAPVIMTSAGCRNGTERCAEAAAQLPSARLVVNLQGDALLTPPAMVESLIARLGEREDTAVATPAIRLTGGELLVLQQEEAKGLVGGTTVVTDDSMQALYFSKRLLPYIPDRVAAEEVSAVRQHVGVYAYRREALERYADLPESEIERLEGLEQLRFLMAGIRISVVDSPSPAYPLRELNNPQDVPAIEQALALAGIE